MRSGAYGTMIQFVGATPRVNGAAFSCSGLQENIAWCTGTHRQRFKLKLLICRNRMGVYGCHHSRSTPSTVLLCEGGPIVV
jgi:hypothetical protein